MIKLGLTDITLVLKNFKTSEKIYRHFKERFDNKIVLTLWKQLQIFHSKIFKVFLKGKCVTDVFLPLILFFVFSKQDVLSWN